MSEKFDLSHSTYKYNISPSQLLFKPSPPPPPPPPSSISTATTTSRSCPSVPESSPTIPPTVPPSMPAMNPTYHPVPAFDSPPSITDNDDTASFAPTARLISPSRHATSLHTPLKAAFTIHPTHLLRVVVLCLLSASVTLFAFRSEASRAKGLVVSGDGPRKQTEGNFGTIPALVFLSLATLRTFLAIAFPVSRTTARWIGARGLNAAVDVALVTAMTAATILPTKRRNWSLPWEWAHKQGFIVSWVTIPLYALAALDTGSPDRFYMQMGRPSGGVDFRFRREEWDTEAREMAERR